MASLDTCARVSEAGAVRSTRFGGGRSSWRQELRRSGRAIVHGRLVLEGSPWPRDRSPPAGIALTFDDGPTDLTPDDLSVLDCFQARATFFVVGELCAARPDLVAAITARGHQLAGHGYTHRRFPSLSASELKDELLRTAELLPASSRWRPLVRPPMARFLCRRLSPVRGAGFTTALWSYNSGDWCTKSANDVLAAFED